MKIVGIDNGLKGAVVYIDSETKEIKIIDTPTINLKRANDAYDIPRMKAILFMFSPDMICLEVAQAMPGQGVVSMFKTGYGYGLWTGMIAGLGLAYETVRPQAWQKDFFAGKSGDTKVIAYQVCCELYPKIADQLKGPKGGLKDGRCDALLLSEYCRRKHSGHVKN